MKNMKESITNKITKNLINVGEMQVSAYSLWFHLYEPKQSDRLIKEQLKKQSK